MRNTYKIIHTESELDLLINYCKQTGYCSFDFETTTAELQDPEFVPTILGVCFQPGSGWVIPLGHKDSVFKHKWKKILRKFALEVIENPAIVKIAWNAMFDGKIFRKYGYRVRGRYLDGMLAKYILNEERPNDLKSMVDLLLPDFAGYDLQGKPGKKSKKHVKVAFWSNVELEELSEYCALDADCTLRILLHLEHRLWDTELYYFLRNMYMPLVRIVSDTTLHGMLIDKPYLEELMQTYQGKIAEIEKELRAIDIVEDFNDIQIEERVDALIEDIQEEIDYAGLSDRVISNREEKISRLEAGEPTNNKERKLFEEINFGSVPQMTQLLYLSPDGFEFPIVEKSKTGNPSTAESALLKLQPQDDTGFIKALLKLRASEKLYSTYVKGVYENNLAANPTGPGYKVFPGFLLHGTVTSRWSSRGPNLQNIPRTTTASDIKRYFIAPKDYYFVEVDLSQAELRVAAEMSGDEAMINIFKEGKNIHVATAAYMFDVNYDLINSARKDESHPQHLDMVKKHKSAKVLNFTIFYGAGAKKVSEFLTERTGDRYSVQDASDFIERWFSAFPQAEKWIKKIRKQAQIKGYSENLFGWRRRLPILSTPQNKKLEPGSWNEALRQSVNAPIQGASSMITQWINIQVYMAILRGELPQYMHLICSVHDSIEFYVHKDDLKEVLDKMLQISADLTDMGKYLKGKLRKVPMKASAEYGVTWGNMHSYNPKDDMDYSLKYDQEYDSIFSINT